MNAANTTRTKMSCAHSKDKPGVSLTTTHINVRFVMALALQLQIKHPMKTALTENKPAVLEIAPPSSQTPFADLMLHPEKLEAALKTAKIENDAFAASRRFGRNHAGNSHSPPELKETGFFLEASFAQSVKLAADFTDWEKFPLDMIKSEDDVWFIFVPLAPGSYSYRFIVDGVWCDDPHSILHEPNPFGTANAVVRVT